jgi:serine protease Do
VNSDECAAFLLADEVLPNLGRIPKNVFGRPAPWLGANGLEPMDPEVAKFLKLESQAGLVVSEVLEGSPAEKAGMKERDILLEVDGKALPRLKPDGAVVGHVEREIDRRATGEVMKLTVLRGSERIELNATLEESPTSPREVERRYFEQLGLTIRAFAGVVAHFVKPSTALTTAGLRTDDWIKEIDGQEIKTFADAAEKLAAIEKDTSKTEYVLLASRGGETAVLRVKLK